MYAKFGRCIPGIRELIKITDLLNQVHADLGVIKRMESIHCLDLELLHNPRYKGPRRLQRHAYQVNSQNGEDGVIQEIFRRIGISSRVFAEVGVGDGTQNNTAFLLSQGWKGFWIDASDAFLRTISGRKDLIPDCLISCVSFVDKENIAGIFSRLGVPRDFDLMSLDIDQNTFYIWEALGKFKPRVVVVEYNASIPPDIDWKVQYVANRVWDGTQNFGASLKAFEKLGRQLGYSLVGCDFNGVNAFFVRDDLIADKFADPFTAENHYEPPRYVYDAQPRGYAGAILDRQPSGY